MARHKEFNYDEKLETARDLFWKKGYNATSLSDLEHATQINRSSLYQTYGNKQDLFIKSLNNYLSKKENQYNKAKTKSTEPLEALKNIIRSVMNSAIEENNCLFTNTVFELALSDKDLAVRLQKETQKVVDSFEKLLQEAKEIGSLKTNKDLTILAHFLVAGLASIYYNQILFKNTYLTKQTAELLIQSIEY